MSRVSLLVLLCAASISASCHSTAAPPQAHEVVVWKPIGTWSGRGDRQTESFTSDTGGFRVRWETKNPAHEGAGRLRVVFRSGDSGRAIIEAIDFHGVGRGAEEVGDNVRWYYLTIESADVDWTVSVDERLNGQSAR